MTIPPYLQSYLRLAEELDQRLDGCPPDEIDLLKRKMRELVRVASHLQEKVYKLEQRAAGADRASA